MKPLDPFCVACFASVFSGVLAVQSLAPLCLLLWCCWPNGLLIWGLGLSAAFAQVHKADFDIFELLMLCPWSHRLFGTTSSQRQRTCRQTGGIQILPPQRN